MFRKIFFHGTGIFVLSLWARLVFKTLIHAQFEVAFAHEMLLVSALLEPLMQNCWCRPKKYGFVSVAPSASVLTARAGIF